MAGPGKALKVWAISLENKSVITIDEEWFRTYVTDELGAVNDCYVAQVLDDGEII